MYLTLLLVWVSIVTLTSGSQLLVLRSDLDLATAGEAISGAQLMDNRSVEMRDFGVCIRFNLKYVANHEPLKRPNDAPILMISTWTRPEYVIWLELRARFPITFIVFGHPMAKGSFGRWMLREQRNGKPITWSTHAWNHVCFSYEKDSSFVKIMANGKFLNFNHRERSVENATLESNILQNVWLGRCQSTKCSSFGGEFSDFNLWNRPLSNDEMTAFTSCSNLDVKGNVVSWDSAQFQLFNMSRVYKSFDSVCKRKTPGNFLISEKNTFLSHVRTCNKMKGKARVVINELNEDDLMSLNEGTCSDLVWTGFWDKDTEGMFMPYSDPEQKEQEAIEWAYGEPNGGKEENCAVTSTSGKWHDVDCSSKKCGFCYLQTTPPLKIRGLCPRSRFDHTYSWTGETRNGKFVYFGISSTLLAYNGDTNEWQLQLFSEATNSTYAVTKGEAFPFGSKPWQVTGDLCSKGRKDVEEVILNLNHCNENEFNCADGLCIPMEERCDRRRHCADLSDELGCESLLIDKSYARHLPPGGETEGSRVSVFLHVQVLGILNISETESFINLQLKVNMLWHDSRLQMFNLKEDKFLNSLTYETRQKLWAPIIVFYNTDDKHESVNDEKVSAFLERNGSHELSAMSALHNKFSFEGSSNAVIFSRIYTFKYACEFDMSHYPFDLQRCTAVFVPRSNLRNFVRLVAEKLENLAPVNKAQFFVRSSNITSVQVGAGVDGVKVELILGRSILGTFLTIYMPTTLICFVSFTTNFYEREFFEGIVTMNLTSLFLLISLFTRVADSLPKTDYLKNLDVWLIFVLSVPFHEILIHTLLDILRVEHNKGGKSEGKLRSLLFFARFVVPIIFGVFSLGYFTYGNSIDQGHP